MKAGGYNSRNVTNNNWMADWAREPKSMTSLKQTFSTLNKIPYVSSQAVHLFN